MKTIAKFLLFLVFLLFTLIALQSCATSSKCHTYDNAYKTKKRLSQINSKTYTDSIAYEKKTLKYTAIAAVLFIGFAASITDK